MSQKYHVTAKGAIHPKPGRTYARYRVTWQAKALNKHARQMFTLAAMRAELGGASVKVKRLKQSSGTVYEFAPVIMAGSKGDAWDQINRLVRTFNRSHGIVAHIVSVAVVRRSPVRKPVRKPAPIYGATVGGVTHIAPSYAKAQY